jgi:hypothetical protein
MLQGFAALRIDEVERDQIHRPASARGPLPSHPDEHTAAGRERTQIKAVWALGWRCRHRDGPSQGCVELRGTSWGHIRRDDRGRRVAHDGWSGCRDSRGRLRRRGLRRYCLGIEETLAAFHEPPHVSRERKPSGHDPQCGTLGEK